MAGDILAVARAETRNVEATPIPTLTTPLPKTATRLRANVVPVPGMSRRIDAN